MINLNNSLIQDKLESIYELGERSIQWFKTQKLWKQIIISLLIISILCYLFLMLYYHKLIIAFAVASSNKWREMPGGQLIMFTLIFIVSFPPLFGFSALCTLTGMIWGFPHGWWILASSSVIGSTCSFLLFRHVLKNYARRMLESSKVFELFTLVLNDKNAFWLLASIRLCPLPYSLSNGALAAIPDIKLLTFIGASVITSPKLLISTFIGSKLQNMGEAKSGSEVFIDFLSIAIALSAFGITTMVLYRKMQEKLNAIDNGLSIRIDDDGNFEIDDDDYDEDNLIV